jgi:hypothetical protein
LVGALVLSLSWGRGPLLARLLARLYDERLDRFAGFLAHLFSTGWGGQVLQFRYFDHQRQSLVTFNAAAGDLLHNVPFDVVVRVGLVPAALLLVVVLPLYCRALGQLRFALLDRGSAAPALITAGFLITLTVQWLFQPLIYGDGLLFYVGFVLLGYLAAKPPVTSVAVA